MREGVKEIDTHDWGRERGMLGEINLLRCRFPSYRIRHVLWEEALAVDDCG